MKQIIVFPRGQLDAKDKERLSKHDIIAVEADDPSKVVAVFPGVPLVESNDMLTMALKVLAGTVSLASASPASKFTMALAEKMEAEAARKDIAATTNDTTRWG